MVNLAKKMGSFAAAVVVAFGMGSASNAMSVHTLNLAQLGTFAQDAVLTTPGVTQVGPSVPVAGGVNFTSEFAAVTGAAMAAWTTDPDLNIAVDAGDAFALNIKNQNFSPWDFEVFVDEVSIGTLPGLVPGVTGFIQSGALASGEIDKVTIKISQIIPIGTDTSADFRVTPVPATHVPVPSAAWLGMATLCGLCLVRKKNKRSQLASMY